MAVNKKESGSNDDFKFMKGVKSFFYEPGIGKKRIEILCRQLKKFGGTVSEKIDNSVTHIIMSKNSKMEKLLRTLKINKINESVKIVAADWLSACFLAFKQCDFVSYQIRDVQQDITMKNKMPFSTVDNKEDDMVKDSPKKLQTGVSSSSNLGADAKISALRKSTHSQVERKRKLETGEDVDSDSSYVDSEDEIVTAEASPSKLPMKESPSKPTGTWVCMNPSNQAGQNLNQHITDKLEVLAKAYTNTQDRWRALGYQKAISSIKNHPKRIESAEEVRNLPFIGERLAKKIAEILETGHLRRLDHLDPKIEIINTFADVWGAGPKTAEAWVAQGYRSLDDLRLKAELTFQQKIGLKFYEEFLEKIKREEVEEIERHIRETACEIKPGMEVVTCGSYRRGRQLCGDVDILISHPDGHSHKGFLVLIIDALQKKGLITDDLITVDNDEQRKYMGVFKLPGQNSKHRRLDIIVAPYSEWACALVHFTGSGRLNRSMRQLAKTKDMSLSEHALREGVIRKGQEKLHEGTVVPITKEEDIFLHLDLDYLQPTERDW